MAKLALRAETPQTEMSTVRRYLDELLEAYKSSETHLGLAATCTKARLKANGHCETQFWASSKHSNCCSGEGMSRPLAGGHDARAVYKDPRGTQ
ncbi:hypothetical protein Slin15195_G129440 [Septoria linicola]|uniref:Uncharacterized protein n=1 Tax=Septoria linicola TaxID=215465 RepID=A0A9Q9EQZ4_9PEZI|nr:hypothetical protein Slin15195_G129440 [Septoria linicola]